MSLTLRLAALFGVCLLGSLFATHAPTAPAPKGGAAATNAWPLFRGNPRQTGVAVGKLPANIVKLWEFKTGDAIESAPAIADGVVYAASMDEHVYAVDFQNGKSKWKFKGGPFKAPPSVQGGFVYSGDLDGNLYCIDAAKGTKKWSFETGAEVGGVNFYKTAILFASHDETLYCVNNSGKELWKFKTEGPIYGSVAVADGKTFLVGCDSQMHVIDIMSGKEERAVDLDGQTGATAAVLGSNLYVGTMRNEVRAINWQKGESTWTYRGKRSGQAFFSSPAVSDRYVVIGSRDKQVHCIDRKSGSGVWAFSTGGNVDSSPVIVDDRVVVGSLGGEVTQAATKTQPAKVSYYVYILALSSGKVVQKLEVDSPVSASAAVVNGRIVIGTQKGTLYCFGEKKK